VVGNSIEKIESIFVCANKDVEINNKSRVFLI
jgi:hypothetical protein